MLCHFGADSLRFNAEAFRLLVLFFELLAALLELCHHVLKIGVLAGNELPRPVNNAAVHSEALGNCESVALSGNADEELIGRRKGLHVKLTAGVFYPRCLERVHLYFGVVGRCGELRSVELQLFDYRHRESRALHRVGSRAQLVKKHKASVVCLFKDPNGVVDMGREGGKALLNALLVADIGKDVFKDGDGACLPGGNHQTAHCHKGKKSDCFKGYGFTAGIGSGYYEHVEIAAEGNVHRNDFRLVDKRVAGFFKNYLSVVGQSGDGGVHLVRKAGFRKIEVQLDDCGIVLYECSGMVSDVAGELVENTLYLLLFLRF